MTDTGRPGPLWVWSVLGRWVVLAVEVMHAGERDASKQCSSKASASLLVSRLLLRFPSVIDYSLGGEIHPFFLLQLLLVKEFYPATESLRHATTVFLFVFCFCDCN